MVVAPNRPQVHHDADGGSGLTGQRVAPSWWSRWRDLLGWSNYRGFVSRGAGGARGTNEIDTDEVAGVRDDFRNWLQLGLEARERT
jgi:hypothetical protein